MPVGGETDRESAVHVERGIGDDAHLEGIFHQRIVGTSLAEDRDLRRIDGTEVERTGKGIVVAFVQFIAIQSGMSGLEAEEGAGECAAAADGLLLGTGTCLHTTTGMSGTGKVEQGRVVAFFDQSLGYFETVVFLHSNRSAVFYFRCIHGTQILVVATAAVNHRLHVEVDTFSRRSDVVAGFDDVGGFVEHFCVVVLLDGDLRVVIAFSHNDYLFF